MKTGIAKYSGGFLAGAVLFLAYSIYSVGVNSQLAKRLMTVEGQNDSLNTRINQFQIYSDLQQDLFGKAVTGINHLTSFSGGGLFQQTQRRNGWSLTVVFFQGCESCFDQDLPIWSDLIASASKSHITCFAVDVDFNRELVMARIADGSIRFPVLKDDGSFAGLFRNRGGYIAVALLLNPKLEVSRIYPFFPLDLAGTIHSCVKAQEYINQFHNN